MAKYKPQHSRLLFIDRRIREKRYPNRSTLAEEWETSIKTIGRDLDYLRHELDAPLAYSARHRGYYYTEDQFQLPAIQVRERDLFAIYLADKLLGQYQGTPIYDSLRSVFSKIEQALPDKVQTTVGSDQALFTVIPPFATMIRPEILDMVFHGLRTSTRLDIDYQSPGGEPVRRRIDPYHGVRYEGDWYVVAHCHLRGAIRTFSLARMHAVRLTGERFSHPAHFDFRRLFASPFGIHWGTDAFEVRIHFGAGAAAFIRERTWHPSQLIEEEQGGSLILNLRVNHLLELKRWILSWGAEARVLSPPELVAELRDTARTLVKGYTPSHDCDLSRVK